MRKCTGIEVAATSRSEQVKFDANKKKIRFLGNIGKGNLGTNIVTGNKTGPNMGINTGNTMGSCMGTNKCYNMGPIKFTNTVTIIGP